jgi:hypothetical protein
MQPGTAVMTWQCARPQSLPSKRKRRTFEHGKQAVTASLVASEHVLLC